MKDNKGSFGPKGHLGIKKIESPATYFGVLVLSSVIFLSVVLVTI